MAQETNITLHDEDAPESILVFNTIQGERLRIGPGGFFIDGELIADKFKIYDRFSDWLTDAGYPVTKPTRRKKTKKQ